ncbi:MAG: ABC transporter permease [Nocardioidaceae bacterium]
MTKRGVVGALSLLAGAAVWEVYGRLQESALFVPTFTRTVVALLEQVQTELFWRSYADTLVPFAYGWLGALVFGVVVGVVMGRSRVLTGLGSPYLAFLNALPISTLVPIVVIAAGIDTTARALLVFLFAVVDVILTSAAGARYVDHDLIDMARSFGMSRVRTFRKVMLPGAMPGILAAVRVGTGRAIVGMVVMELLLVSAGVGKLISRYKDTFASADLYAVVVSLGIFGLVMLGLVRTLEDRVLRWRPTGGPST